MGTHTALQEEIVPQPSRSEKKALSRRRILDAAREVFFREGFMAANLDEVAERAGVAKGTLYRYFESKADLYVAVLASNGRVFVEKMKDAARVGPTATARVLALSGFYYHHYHSHRDYFQIFWAVENQDVIGELPERALDEIVRLWQDCLEVLDEQLRAGVASGEFEACNTWEVASLLWTTANALIRAESNVAIGKIRREPPATVYSDAVGLIVKGLAPSR